MFSDAISVSYHWLWQLQVARALVIGDLDKPLALKSILCQIFKHLHIKQMELIAAHVESLFQNQVGFLFTGPEAGSWSIIYSLTSI